MYLAPHDHRVHRLAHSVAHAVAQHRDVAGLRIHLHLGHVAAIGEGVLVDCRDLAGTELRCLLARVLFFRRGGASSRISMPRSVPTIEKRPASKTISATAASSVSDAAFLPF